MPTQDTTVAELAERVSRLEERLATGPWTPEPRDDPAPFWALDELKRRQPRPAVVYTGVVETALGDPVEWQMGHDSAQLVEEDWTGRVSALAALGHPSRLRILQLVARGEAATAAEMAHSDGLGTTGQIYHHLRQLVSAGWLRSTTKGRHEIPPERLVSLVVILAASR